MVSIDEIEDRIAELHREGKATRQIAADVHKNLTFVGSILRKRFPEEYSTEVTMSKETQALKLFSSKRTPTQVAIELNESPDSVEKYFANYWRLERMKSLYKIYLENRKAVPNLLSLCKLLKEKGIPTRQYNEVFDLIEREICRKEHQVSWSDNHIYDLDEIEKELASADSL
jgi:hypothetical protein